MSLRSVATLTLALSACLARPPAPRQDWLVDDLPRPARVVLDPRLGLLHLENGLVRRSLSLASDAATVALDELSGGASLLRAVGPEARLVLDGTPVVLGGLLGQPDRAYLRPEWLERMQPDPQAWHLAAWREGGIEERLGWARVRRGEGRAWPPPGRSVTLTFRAPADSPWTGVEVDVVHELYDGVPILGKRIEVRNGGARSLRVDRFRSEELNLVEAESQVDPDPDLLRPALTVRSEMSFGGMSGAALERCVRWLPDPAYTTQVAYALDAPLTLVVEPERGPAVELQPGEALRGFTSWLLVHDSTERERQGLAERRLWRTLAPWVSENPLMMHVRSAEPEAVRLAIDQCAEVGFEMVILTFGSGFDIEDDRPETLARWKELADYAHARGVGLGGYSLLASRRISDEHDVIDPVTGETGHARFGNSPCLGSAWGLAYFEKLRRFLEFTGFDLLEHDGSYPGDPCASTTHPGHRGLEDSVWTQWRTIADFYAWCRARGVYLNVPDAYMLAGSNKTGMGYRETNWSLPRQEQVLHGRQNIFDGTWTKPPTMGWMFVPLTEYHGGGASATLEPLAEHLDAYAAHLANNLAAGVQACWRGPRLFDGEAARQLVAEWVAWFVRHRDILESDVVHLRRPDGRDLDALLHVNPRLEERALLAVWNPSSKELERVLRVPLAFAGLGGRVAAREVSPGGPGAVQRLTLDRAGEGELTVRLPASGFRAWVFTER